jgi:hypothetical protein
MSKIGRLDVISSGALRCCTPEEKQRIVAESYAGPRLVSAISRRNGLSYEPAVYVASPSPGRAPYGSGRGDDVCTSDIGDNSSLLLPEQSDPEKAVTTAEEFNAPFTRLDWISRDSFDLQWHRNTGTWVCLHCGLLCSESVRKSGKEEMILCVRFKNVPTISASIGRQANYCHAK